VAETRASTENLKRDSPSGYSGVIGTSSMPLQKRKKGAPIHDESGTSSGLAQCPGCVAASGETRRIPRVPPLSFCGTPQGGAPDDLAPNALVDEIERTRADLARTIDEIADRVAPRNVARRTVDQAKDRLSQVDPLIGGAVALAVVSVTCYVIWRKLRKNGT